MADDGGGPFVSATAVGVRCAVRVAPRAARNAIQGGGADGGLPRVSVTAVPHKGAANAAVIRLLARAWRVPKSSVTVQSGASARTKVLTVAGDPADLTARLIAWERDLIED